MISVDGYCRTCLREFDDLRESLRKHIISSEIADKLECCTMTNVKLNDEFPKHLCDCCLNQLEKFDAFRIMCHESIARFREISTKNTSFLKTEKDVTMEEVPIAEANLDILQVKVNFSEDSTPLLETEIHQLLPQIIDPIRNPLEIQNKRKRSQKKSLAKVKSRKSDRVLSKTVEKEEKQPCDDRLNVPASDKKSSFCLRGKLVEHSKPNIETKSEKQLQQKDDEINSSKSLKVFQCETCSKRFFVEHKFTAHLRKHEGLKPYPCPHSDCGRGFARTCTLKDHLKKHEGLINWVSCEEPGCNRRYSQRSAMKMHLRKHHKKGIELKTFVCEICGKVFKTSAVLNDHRYIHKDKSERPFECSEPDCKRRFYKKQRLKVHMLRHAGIKKFVCSICGMGKTTRSELNVHMNYHTLERQFPCQSCPQTFTNPGNLKRHVRAVHENVRNFACRYCDRTFAKDETRKHHEMTHTGEKPHECSVCGKRFIQPTALRTHQKTHLRQNTDFVEFFQKENT